VQSLEPFPTRAASAAGLAGAIRMASVSLVALFAATLDSGTPQAACRAIAALGAAAQLAHVLLRPAPPGRRRRLRPMSWLPPLLRPSSRKGLLGVELEGAGGNPGRTRSPASGQPAALVELNDAAVQAAAAARSPPCDRPPSMRPAGTKETAAV